MIHTVCQSFDRNTLAVETATYLSIIPLHALSTHSLISLRFWSLSLVYFSWFPRDFERSRRSSCMFSMARIHPDVTEHDGFGNLVKWTVTQRRRFSMPPLLHTTR